ncbi:UNVERIFIED_CONTAM: putative mitochondrial protein [Sesamum radiatum]|uniref:Mitochondrial protein n=1 Tax=Sesamum radiatum TaxID=300843 RepID=A0AAW2TU07_SESRA
MILVRGSSSRHGKTSLWAQLITEQSKKEEYCLRVELESLKEDEERLWKQRSRVDWLKAGDRNTRFFHTRASNWKKKNEINMLQEDNGNMITDMKEIQNLITTYFCNSFTSKRPQEQHIDDVLRHMEPKVTMHMNQSLTQAYTTDEIVLITDNILVAYEVNHFLKNTRRGKEYFIALKLDMSKAYDCVKWSFLKRVLEKLGLNDRFVRLVFLYISTVSFSFILIVDIFGNIVPERGIRQGDPLSPYLFILCAEALSSMLLACENQGELRSVRVARNAPQINHLLFADDTVIYCKAVVEEVLWVKEVLKQYELASGQLINKEKSCMVFSKNTLVTRREELSNIMEVRFDNVPTTYLGLPAFIGSSKTLT